MISICYHDYNSDINPYMSISLVYNHMLLYDIKTEKKLYHSNDASIHKYRSISILYNWYLCTDHKPDTKHSILMKFKIIEMGLKRLVILENKIIALGFYNSGLPS